MCLKWPRRSSEGSWCRDNSDVVCGVETELHVIHCCVLEFVFPPGNFPTYMRLDLEILEIFPFLSQAVVSPYSQPRTVCTF
jgi:hypothetical protein